MRPRMMPKNWRHKCIPSDLRHSFWLFIDGCHRALCRQERLQNTLAHSIAIDRKAMQTISLHSHTNRQTTRLMRPKSGRVKSPPTTRQLAEEGASSWCLDGLTRIGKTKFFVRKLVAARTLRG
jgi:hypothetical protein